MTRSTLTHLECGACATTYEPDQLINLCPACGKPLLARYDLRRAAETLTRESLAARRTDMWRYQEVLPVRDDAAILSLG
ncbi:MAG: threonine synthase, partial [Roseiflexaceae bacterium]